MQSHMHIMQGMIKHGVIQWEQVLVFPIFSCVDIPSIRRLFESHHFPWANIPRRVMLWRNLNNWMTTSGGCFFWSKKSDTSMWFECCIGNVSISRCFTTAGLSEVIPHEHPPSFWFVDSYKIGLMNGVWCSIQIRVLSRKYEKNPHIVCMSLVTSPVAVKNSPSFVRKVPKQLPHFSLTRPRRLQWTSMTQQAEWGEGRVCPS